MSLLLHYTGQDYISRGQLPHQLTPGSTSAFADGCKTGRGFVFDGTSNSRLQNISSINNNQISISTWFYTTVNIPLGGRGTIFSTGNGGQHQIVLDIFDENRLRFLVVHSDNSVSQIYTLSANTIALNTWYHVCATINKTTRELAVYLNGTLTLYSVYENKPIQTTHIYFIGGRYDGNGNMNGRICNLKVYSHLLSAKEIAEDYKSLILQYKLDKPLTTQITDHSGFMRHITNLVNTTTNSSLSRVYGGSLANDGTKNCYGSLNLSEWNGMNEITFALRFRYVQQAGNHCYFSCRTTAAGVGINIFKIGANNNEFYIDIAGRQAYILSYDLVSGNWYDLVAVKTPTQKVLYINGALAGTFGATGSISNMGNTYTSVSRSVADDVTTLVNVMNGNVQDIRFYAKALTQAEVTELYQTRFQVDKAGNLYCYEVIEGQSEVGMKKNGQLLCDEIIEGDDGVFQIVKGTKTIKTKEIKEI